MKRKVHRAFVEEIGRSDPRFAARCYKTNLAAFYEAFVDSDPSHYHPKLPADPLERSVKYLDEVCDAEHVLD